MRWRFTLAVTLSTFIALVALLMPLASYLRAVETDRLQTALVRDAFVIAGRSAADLDALASGTAVETTGIAEIAQQYRADRGPRVVVVDGAGTAIVTSDDDDMSVGEAYESRPEVEQALAGQIATGVRHSETLGIDLLYVAVPVLDGERVLGAVRLTHPADAAAAAIDGKVMALGVAAVTTVLVAGIVGFVLATNVTRRLRALTAITHEFAAGRLDQRAEASHGSPELRSLAMSFNSMAERLAEALARQRRFAADASHQLRTPLTALRLRLDRARELAESGAGDDAAERIRAAVEETDRLESLVEGLLALSRDEAEPAEIERVDLDRLARERVTQWEPLAEESGIVLEARSTGPLPALGAVNRIEQVLDNLIDNAIAASPPGSTIVVSADDDPAPVVRVTDSGPGIPADRLAQATERFWTTKPDGTGLGLFIAAQLAQSMNGRLELANRQDSGLTASLILPPVMPRPVATHRERPRRIRDRSPR